MCSFRFTIPSRYRQDVEKKLKVAQALGDRSQINRWMVILAVINRQSLQDVATILCLDLRTVEKYVAEFVFYGLKGAPRKKSSGRPGNLKPHQKDELRQLIKDGPDKCGFSGACWRSPMIQQLILDRFGVCYNVFYIAQLMHNLGFSWQKAAFVSDHLNEEKRRQWRCQTWPHILRLRHQRQALLLFGDEASFPQWGTLSYTWAPVGEQPKIKTSGKRKGYKVFGLIEYLTGQLFYQGQEGRLNSDSYIAFLRGVLDQTGDRYLILIQDGARYHTSALTKAFFEEQKARLTVFQLPTYSPDYNPIEKLWKKIKDQDTHLHYFPTFESLTNKVETALLKFARIAEEILALCSLPSELAKAA